MQKNIEVKHAAGKAHAGKVVYAGVLCALGLILPQAFHMFGQNAGMMFLPIHLPVLMAGLLLGPVYGSLVGLIVPILGSAITGMPPVPKVYFMLVELIAYGFLTGLLKNRCNIYLNLIISMAVGRILYGCSLIAGVCLLHVHAPFANGAAFVSGIVSGIPGIVLQLILLPVLYRALQKGGLTFRE